MELAPFFASAFFGLFELVLEEIACDSKSGLLVLPSPISSLARLSSTFFGFLVFVLFVFIGDSLAEGFWLLLLYYS